MKPKDISTPMTLLLTSEQDRAENWERCFNAALAIADITVHAEAAVSHARRVATLRWGPEPVYAMAEDQTENEIYVISVYSLDGDRLLGYAKINTDAMGTPSATFRLVNERGEATKFSSAGAANKIPVLQVCYPDYRFCTKSV